MFRASVLIQYIYENLEFKSPFFLTYLATSLLSVHVLAHHMGHYIQKHFRGTETQRLRSDSSSSASSSSLLQAAENMSHDPIVDKEEQLEDSSSQGASVWEIIKVASVIAPIWFLANCLYNYSLLMTSVSSSTIISNLSASFTMFFSWYMGLEEIHYGKVLGVVICFAGK